MAFVLLLVATVHGRNNSKVQALRPALPAPDRRLLTDQRFGGQ